MTTREDIYSEMLSQMTGQKESTIRNALQEMYLHIPDPRIGPRFRKPLTTSEIAKARETVESDPIGVLGWLLAEIADEEPVASLPPLPPEPVERKEDSDTLLRRIVYGDGSTAIPEDLYCLEYSEHFNQKKGGFPFHYQPLRKALKGNLADFWHNNQGTNNKWQIIFIGSLDDVHTVLEGLASDEKMKERKELRKREMKEDAERKARALRTARSTS